MFTVRAVIVGIAVAASQPASALVEHFSFDGRITGSEYGAAAAADIYTSAPIGSVYTLDFSYDTATVPLYSGPTYGSYVNVPVNAVFTLGGTSFNLPKLGIATGSGPFDGSVRFTLFGNAPFSSARLAGYQLLDFSFTLSDPTGTALPTGTLPISFDLARFANRSVRPRFAFGAHGETALTLSVDPTVTTAVPEPASWTLLITGFAATGLALRRGSRPATATCAQG